MGEDFVAALTAKNWYAVAAIALFALIRLWKYAPISGALYAKVPDGYRWIIPVCMGAAVGFTDAWSAGDAWSVALLKALGGVAYVALPAMGAQGLLKEAAQAKGGAQ